MNDHSRNRRRGNQNQPHYNQNGRKINNVNYPGGPKVPFVPPNQAMNGRNRGQMYQNQHRPPPNQVPRQHQLGDEPCGDPKDVYWARRRYTRNDSFPELAEMARMGVKETIVYQSSQPTSRHQVGQQVNSQRGYSRSNRPHQPIRSRRNNQQQQQPGQGSRTNRQHNQPPGTPFNHTHVKQVRHDHGQGPVNTYQQTQFVPPSPLIEKPRSNLRRNRPPGEPLKKPRSSRKQPSKKSPSNNISGSIEHQQVNMNVSSGRIGRPKPPHNPPQRNNQANRNYAQPQPDQNGYRMNSQHQHPPSNPNAFRMKGFEPPRGGVFVPPTTEQLRQQRQRPPEQVHQSPQQQRYRKPQPMKQEVHQERYQQGQRPIAQFSPAPSPVPSMPNEIDVLMSATMKKRKKRRQPSQEDVPPPLPPKIHSRHFRQRTESEDLI